MNTGEVLPEGWAAATLGDIRTDQSATIDPAKTPDETFELYSIPAFPSRRPEVVRGTEIGSTKQSLAPGTVVLSKINPRINRVWVVGVKSDHRKIGSSEWIPFFPVDGIDAEYLAFFMQQDKFRNYLAANVSGVGGSLMRVRPAIVDPFPLVVPPTIEQQRIVAAVESFVTRLDDAVATLARVQRNLERYRASVLKAAVEGRLVPTEAELARAEGRNYEPASVLLDRILAERRRRWEQAELARMKAADRLPADDRWKQRYEEPSGPDIDELPALPDGWCWTSVEQIGDVTGGLTQNSKRESLPVQLPFLRVANVYANELRLDEIKAIGVAEAEIKRASLVRGDLLVVEGNGSIDQIGRVALWDGSIEPCLHQNHLIKVRFSPIELGQWTLCWLLAPSGRRAIERTSSSTSGLNTLSISKVGRLPVPLAPLAEQRRSVVEVDRLSTLARAAFTETAANAIRCDRLRQSILKWAFEGRLVDQDPADEAASELLERILAERAVSTNHKPKRNGRREARATTA